MARWLLALLALAACSSEREEPSSPSRAARKLPAAAWVNGEPIELEEVAALSQSARVPPAEALTRLVRERLLLQHAREGGYGDRPELTRALARARVRALLGRAVEAGTRDDALDERRRRLDALLASLAQRTPPQYDEQAIARFATTPP